MTKHSPCRWERPALGKCRLLRRSKAFWSCGKVPRRSPDPGFWTLQPVGVSRNRLRGAPLWDGWAPYCGRLIRGRGSLRRRGSDRRTTRTTAAAVSLDLGLWFCLKPAVQRAGSWAQRHFSHFSAALHKGGESHNRCLRDYNEDVADCGADEAPAQRTIFYSPSLTLVFVLLWNGTVVLIIDGYLFILIRRRCYGSQGGFFRRQKQMRV